MTRIALSLARLVPDGSMTGTPRSYAAISPGKQDAMQDIAIYLVGSNVIKIERPHARTYELFVADCGFLLMCVFPHEFVIFMGHLT